MKASQESPFPESGTIWEINLKLLYSVFLIAVAFWIWPSDARWYAFYAMSVICCVAAAGLIFNALRAMRQLQIKRKKWNEIQARGKAPKQATLASVSAQKNGGMR